MIPPYSLTYSRRLFPDSGTQGVLTLDAFSASPSLSVDAVVPKNFDYTPKANSEEDLTGDGPSTSLLSGYALVKGTSFYSIGVSLSGLMSGIRSEFGIMFSRLALDLRIGGTLGVLGLTYWVSGAWNSSDQRTGVDANINSSAEGVALTLKYVKLFSFCFLATSHVNSLITWALGGIQFTLPRAEPASAHCAIGGARPTASLLHEFGTDCGLPSRLSPHLSTETVQETGGVSDRTYRLTMAGQLG